MKTQILPINTLTTAQIAAVAHALRQGALAVFATDTVYGLGTGAFCEASVQKIYALKRRPATQPLQLLVADVAQARQIALLEEGAARLAEAYWPGGLTLILPPAPAGKPLLRGAGGLGVRVPDYAPLARILAHMGGPLCSTSANVHGQPVLTQEQDVLNTFDGQVEYILTAGTLSPTASSVLDVTTAPARLLRAGCILKEELARTYGAPIEIK